MPIIGRYALVTLMPALLIALGATVWGFAAVLALVWLTLIAAGMDRLLEPPRLDDHDHAPWSDDGTAQSLHGTVLGRNHGLPFIRPAY
jgi:alkane 1-monooxygenase